MSSQGAFNLRNIIKDQMVQPEKGKLRFIPETAMKRVLTEENVRRTLEGQNLSTKIDISTLISFVCEKATRIFAILVWSEAASLIDQFYQDQFVDESLPVYCDEEDGETMKTLCCESGNRAVIERHPFKRSEWTERNLEHFCKDDQWPFLSPVFSEKQFRYVFHESTHLPFMEKSCKSQRESYFSVVQEWCVHRDHLQTPNYINLPTDPNQHPRVAVKKLKQTSMSEKEFETVVSAEITALEMIRRINHPHLIKAIAYYKKGNKHCVIFPWAEHGNLRDFWKQQPPKLDGPYLRWIFAQFCGLAGAIERLHHSQEDQATRHGDLKPENILCFDGKGGTKNGQRDYVLVIADVGLSKSHDKVTEIRKEATRTKSGTIMYEPPETELQSDAPRSRRYDVWSLGCIYLEFLVWLLYGANELDRFRSDLSTSGSNARFYVIEEKTAHLNSAVLKWVDWIRKDPRLPEKTAIRSLVELVVTRMLIPDVSNASRRVTQRTLTLSQNNDNPLENPTPSFTFRPPTMTGNLEPNPDPMVLSRATAQEVLERLGGIVKDVADHTLEWMLWTSTQPQGPRQYANFLDLSDRRVPKDPENEYRFTPLDDNWKYNPDIDAAGNIFTDPDLHAEMVQRIREPQLCHRCQNLQLWLPRYTFSDTFTDLETRSQHCDLCRLLKRSTHEYFAAYSGKVEFSRVRSALTLHDGQSQPVVSIYTLPSQDPLHTVSPVSDFQLGFPKLYDPGSTTHVKVLAEWIKSCDESHSCCPKEESFLPTRVLDVSGADPATVRLFCGTRGQTSPGRYLALSHRWGEPSQHRKFCTKKQNINDHQQGMRISDLPRTFRDAIAVTRALSIRYLWIDSVCIIQDDEKDWEIESRLMEQVFSCAYATIAATCASGTDDGFLKPRPPRACVLMRREDGLCLYLCDAIDNFSRDVDRGELNNRGWVLQERALSRRTIYFAESQTYWECGEGIRCETLTKVKNKKASFLGDSHFPNSVEVYVKGMKIELIQSLYERYSNLSLSYDDDRPVAIRGLEKRLMQTLRTTGEFGVFDCYFHRCLLWQNSRGTLKRIKFSRGKPVPSWSWMAYTGGIEYMNVPFGGVSWATDIKSPFQNQAGDEHDDLGEHSESLEIVATAWRLTGCLMHGLVLDDPTRKFDEATRCVVLGSEKADPSAQPEKYYVLIVSAVRYGKNGLYERIGVGVLDEAQIVRHEPADAIRIV